VTEGAACQHPHAEAAALDQGQMRIVPEGRRAMALRVGQRDPQLR